MDKILYSSAVVNLSRDSAAAIEDYSGMHVVVRQHQRRSSVESPAKIQIVQQMNLKKKKVNDDLKLAQPCSRKRQSSKKPQTPMMMKALKGNYKVSTSTNRAKIKKPKCDDVPQPQAEKFSVPKSSLIASVSTSSVKKVKTPKSVPESRPRKLTKRENPNFIGYLPRNSHRHEHQRQRAQQFENYICGAPLQAGLDSDSD